MKTKNISILIVGSQKKWAIENFYINYLKELGYKVKSFKAHDQFENYYHQSIVHKLLTRAKLSGIYGKINKELLEKTDQHHFDIIWIFKGMEIFPETLEKIKKRGIKLVNYNPDHPFIHTFRGSGNKNVKNSVGIYDAHFCYNLSVLKKIETEYHIPCAWLPFAYEPGSFVFPSEKEEIKKACFIGNPDPYRAETIRKLNEGGIEIDVYGNNWTNFLSPTASLRISPAIYKTDFSTIAPKYRLQLNIFRPHNDNSHNMRTFEMPGLGCIELAPDSKEHQMLFSEGKEIFLFQTPQEMIKKAKYILKLPYLEALSIRKASYERCISDGYTYRGRTIQVASWMNQILSGNFPFYFK